VPPSIPPTGRLFLTAALTGMREGELLALRWRDIDWAARRVRVRRNYVRGSWGPPKTRRGSRAVPLADRLAVRSMTISAGPHSLATMSSCSRTLHSARCSTIPTSCAASSARCARPASARCASTTCATPSARAWPRPASRCARCRSGSAIANPRKPALSDADGWAESGRRPLPGSALQRPGVPNRARRAWPPGVERIEHFFVMVEQLLDSALIGGVRVRLTLSDGRVVEGVPVTPASDASQDGELGATRSPRRVDLAGTTVELAALREASIVYPISAV
jgi:hypothetical protein